MEPGHFFRIHLASYVGNFKLIQWGNACCSSLKHWLPCFLILWIRNWFPSWLLRVRSAAPHILSGSAISVISDCPQLSSGVERRSSHEILISSKLFWWIIWFVLSHFQNAIYTQAVTSRLPNTFSRGERERAFPPKMFNTDRERPTSQQRQAVLCLWDPAQAASVCVVFCNPLSSPMPNQWTYLGCVLPQLKTNGTFKSPFFFLIKES